MSLSAGISHWFKMVLLLLVSLLTACGGGGSSTDTASITGTVVAAPVSGANLVITDRNGNVLAGPVTTAADGQYSIDIENASLSGDMIFQATGGTYTDEASAATTSAGMLSAYVPGGTLTSGSAVHLTPASTMLHAMVITHAMTYATAQTAFAAAFGFNADPSIAPADATNPATGATQAQLLAGLRAAAFSQLTRELGLTAGEQFDLLNALAQDIAHGDFNGEDMSGPIMVGAITLPADIQNRFTQALVSFHGSANDQTGLSNSQLGTLMLARFALSNTYQLEYMPGMMDAMQGKTMFMLRITRRDTGVPVTGLMLSLMPMMHMDAHMHSTPVDGCNETATAGTYSCTLYYLMASSMMNNISMGYWELTVMAGMGESATFYPSVMMAMGDTARATLKGQSDMIAGMMMPEQRSYYLFKDGLSGTTGNHTFNLFMAAKESMMSYPVVSMNTVLNSGDMTYELTVNSMTVEVSTNQTDWVMASDNGNGHWSASGISGLNDGTAGTLYVRMNINGEQKTTDGMTPAGDGSNDYAMFTVTP